jgi:CheY-like chemotaxis protein
MPNRFHFLIVDDSPHDRQLMEVHLAELYGERAEVRCVNNFEDGVAEVKKQAPDVAFLDLNMPPLDCKDVIARMHEIIGSHAVIILTGSELKNDTLMDAAVAGADAFFSKDYLKDTALLGQVIGFHHAKNRLKHDGTRTV